MIKVNAHTLNHLSGDANINVIATLEDNFGSTPWERTFEFNNKDKEDNDSTGILRPVVNPVIPVVR